MRAGMLGKLFTPAGKGKKILFLKWYRWVDVDLPSYCRKSLDDCRIVECPRSRVESLIDPSPGAAFLMGEEIADFKEIAFNGLYLWELCKSSICDHLKRTLITWEEDEETIRHYFGKAVQLIGAFEALYEKEKPHAVVVEQGLQYDMRVAVEVARRYGCKTVAMENAFIKDYFFLDGTSGTICNRHFLARNARDILSARKLSGEETEKLRRFMTSYSKMIEQGEAMEPAEIGKRFAIPEGRKIALLFGQVATDAAIVMDSPLYAELTDFIEDAARAMEKYSDHYHLIVRLHPKEAWGNNHHGDPFDNMTLKKLQAAGIDRLAHVTIMHSREVDTYRLMEMAHFGMAINSQAGLELLSLHKPLIVAGDAFYGGKGFTRDLCRRDCLPETINQMISDGALTARQKEDIDKFLYFMIFEYLLPKSLVDCEERVREIFQ